MTIVTVVGARPQFVKAGPLMKAFDEAGLSHILIHTGQHWDRDMSDVFFQQLGISPPAANLGIGAGSHGQQTAKMLAALEKEFERVRPNRVVVLGDTNSTLAGALAAAKMNIPVAHVEAGLRSFNRQMPEEVNRVVADHLANLLFAPTAVAVENLAREGCAPSTIRLVGDVMYDAYQQFAPVACSHSTILDQLDVEDNAFILATIHRAENTDDGLRLRMIFNALQTLAESQRVVVPLHPRTRAALARAGLGEDELRPIGIIGPLPYLDMLALESRAAVIVTDSGGVQKEAYFAKVPCVTLRDETEWTELVATEWNRLCPPSESEAICAAVLTAIGTVGHDVVLYGGGQSALQIARALS